MEECLPFGPETLVFKVGGKMFLLAALDAQPLRFNVKCDPERALELRETYPAVLPGHHMHKAHWNTIVADGSLPDKLLFEWIDHSYQLILESTLKKTKKKNA